MFTYDDFKEKFGTGYANEKNKDFFHRLKKTSKILFGSKCQTCNYDLCQSSLEFHHIDESTKLFNISGFYTVRGKDGKIPKSIKLLVDELNKCVLLCGNCHCEVHAGDRDISTIERIVVTEDMLRIRNKKEEISLICDECKTEFTRNNGQTKFKTSFCSNKCNVNYHARTRIGTKSTSTKPRRTKIVWPSLETLYDSLSEKNYFQVGKELGVSDNAVRKHIKVEKQRLKDLAEKESNI